MPIISVHPFDQPVEPANIPVDTSAHYLVNAAQRELIGGVMVEAAQLDRLILHLIESLGGMDPETARVVLNQVPEARHLDILRELALKDTGIAARSDFIPLLEKIRKLRAGRNELAHTTWNLGVLKDEKTGEVRFHPHHNTARGEKLSRSIDAKVTEVEWTTADMRKLIVDLHEAHKALSEIWLSEFIEPQIEQRHLDEAND